MNSLRTRKGAILALAVAAAFTCLVGSLNTVTAGGEIQPPTGSPSANFARYVAIGDSITAGFASGGLAETQQAVSYPALIAGVANAPAFQQPLISEPGIPAQLALLNIIPSPVIVPKNGLGSPLNLSLAVPYNNLAVPGAKVADAINTVTDSGGLHDVILRGQGTALQQTLIQQPTFVTVWIGNNDVLGAATSGIVIDGGAPGFGFAEPTLTAVPSFTADYRTLMQSLASTGAGIVVADIPNVTDIPYVSTVSPIIANPADGSPLPLMGTTGTGQVRALTANDRVLLPASGAIAAGQGLPGGPALPNSLVLDEAEIGQIVARTTALNQVIHAEAAAVGAAVVPANAIFQSVASEGVSIGGAIFDARFLAGGIFTYDGVHPSPTGHGLVANFFIDAINARFGSSIPQVDLFPLAIEGLGAPDNDPGVIETVPADAVIYSAEARDQLLESWNMPTVFDLNQAVSGIGSAPVISDRYGIQGDQGRRSGKSQR